MLNELYIDLPLVWNRYADGMVECIIESAIEMLNNMEYYSIFSQIDPQALWLRSWMHSFNSRSSIFRAFKKTSLLAKIIEIILNLDNCTDSKYNRSYSIVVHSFRVIQYCIPYARFHPLFGKQINEVVKIIIQKWLFVDTKSVLGRDGYEECVFEVLKAAIKCSQAQKVFTDDVITLLVSQIENRYSVQRLLTIVGSLAPLAEVIIEKICMSGVEPKFWLSEDSQELLTILFRSSQSYKLTKQIPIESLTECQLLSLVNSPINLNFISQSDQVFQMARLLQTKFSAKLQPNTDGLFERFGHGYLLTQLASTRFGAEALVEAEYDQLVVNEIWQLINSFEEQTKKAQTVLTNLLSSAEAVQIFIKVPLEKKQIEAKPKSIYEILKIIFEPEFEHMLFNKMDAQVFALEVILTLSASIESYLYLDSIYDLKKLIRIMSTEIRDERTFLIEQISKRSEIMGTNTSQSRSQMSSAQSVSRPKQTRTQSKPILNAKELRLATTKFLKMRKPTIKGVAQILKSFNSLSSKTADRPEIILDLNAAKSQTSSSSDMHNKCVSKFYNYIKEYGSGQLSEADFTKGMKYFQCGDHRFDWFSAMIFLILDDKDQAVSFLRNYSKNKKSDLVWAARTNGTSAHRLLTWVGHWANRLIEIEFPNLHSSFTFSGFPIGVITQLWLEQCFLNYLKLESILSWLISVIVLGPDYSIYMVVAILKYIEKDIINAQIDQGLSRFLKLEGIEGFDFCDHFDFMKSLQAKYSNTILDSL